MAGDLAADIRALAFDVFGTSVDWCTSVTAALDSAAAVKMASLSSSSSSSNSSSSAPATALTRLSSVDWAAFAQEWRDAYGAFTSGFVPGVTPWKDIDTHHRDSLVALLAVRQLDGVFAPAEIDRLAQVWHDLAPWPDAAEGLSRLGARFVTAALSNGNRALLADLDATGPLGFQRLISAADFGAYKPHPAVYRGACDALRLRPAQVAMVAAHLGDLAGARAQGMRTVYVERRGEEAWTPDEARYREAREWVDVWVGENEEGFVELARRLGV